LEKILTGLGGPNAKLPVYTRVLLGISDFFIKPTILGHLPIPIINKVPNVVLFLGFAIVGGVYLLRYIKTPKGKYKLHATLLRIPILKMIILKIAIARFSRTFASLMGAGVSVLNALEVTGAALGNKVIEEELRLAAIEVRNGKQLSEPISKSKHFPAYCGPNA